MSPLPHPGQPSRVCHFCAGPIPRDEKAVYARTGHAWAHFECWYDGTPFERDPVTGVLASTMTAQSRVEPRTDHGGESPA